MNAPTVHTRISNDGLRYSSKATGSPFRGNDNAMSCFICGRFFERSLGTYRMLAGTKRFVCLADAGGKKQDAA